PHWAPSSDLDTQHRTALWITRNTTQHYATTSTQTHNTVRSPTSVTHTHTHTHTHTPDSSHTPITHTYKFISHLYAQRYYLHQLIAINCNTRISFTHLHESCNTLSLTHTCTHTHTLTAHFNTHTHTDSNES